MRCHVLRSNMADTKQETHRPGALKQQNKAHKHGRHSSKGAIDVKNKGNRIIAVEIDSVWSCRQSRTKGTCWQETWCNEKD